MRSWTITLAPMPRGLQANERGSRFAHNRLFQEVKEGARVLQVLAPPDAPVAGIVREQLARLDGGPPPSEPSPDAKAILGMVEGLASRLEATGGTAEEWTRLMRSYMVLGQIDKAKAAARRARQVLAQDGTGLQMVDAMARELQLTDGTTP